MNWDAVGAIAELAGALGVIATLIYLSLQIRHSARESHANSVHLMNAQTGVLSTTLIDPQSGPLYLKGCLDPDALDRDERIRFHGIMVMAFTAYASQYYLDSRGGVPPEIFGLSVRHARDTIANPGARRWFERHKDMFDGAFVAWIESLIPAEAS